ncbi:MAG TPA: rhomboid family intramembrane serine protease [Polyangia bacterium]|jgi:membrane associated rhomboid family serine protease
MAKLPQRRNRTLGQLFGGRLTPVTTWLLVVELALFIVYAFAAGPAAWRDHLALVPTRAIRGLELWQIASAMLFHVSGLALLGNLIGLFIMGPLLERPWGGRRFLIFFVVTGVLANLAAALVGAAAGWRTPLGGCGPSIVAMMAAFGTMYRREQVLFFGFAPMKGLHVALFFVGLWVVLALLAADFVGVVAYVAAAGLGVAMANGTLPLGRILDRLAQAREKLRLRRLRRRYKVIQGGRAEEKRYLN